MHVTTVNLALGKVAGVNWKVLLPFNKTFNIVYVLGVKIERSFCVALFINLSLYLSLSQYLCVVIFYFLAGHGKIAVQLH